MVLRSSVFSQLGFWTYQFERYLDHFARFYVVPVPPNFDFARSVLRPTMALRELPKSALARYWRRSSSGGAPNHRRSPTSPDCHSYSVGRQESVCFQAIYDLFFHFLATRFIRALAMNFDFLVQLVD